MVKIINISYFFDYSARGSPLIIPYENVRLSVTCILRFRRLFIVFRHLFDVVGLVYLRRLLIVIVTGVATDRTTQKLSSEFRAPTANRNDEDTYCVLTK